jgi:hypothetical protein
VIFETPTGKVNIEFFSRMKHSGYLRKKMAELFEDERPVVKKHLKNIFETQELDKIEYVQKLH